MERGALGPRGPGALAALGTIIVAFWVTHPAPDPGGGVTPSGGPLRPGRRAPTSSSWTTATIARGTRAPRMSSSKGGWVCEECGRLEVPAKVPALLADPSPFRGGHAR